MEQDNTAIVQRFTEFCDIPGTPTYRPSAARTSGSNTLGTIPAGAAGVEGSRPISARRFRPDFWGTADLLAEGDYVVGQWEGGGTHTGDAFSDLPTALSRRARARPCGSRGSPCSVWRTA